MPKDNMRPELPMLQFLDMLSQHLHQAMTHIANDNANAAHQELRKAQEVRLAAVGQAIELGDLIRDLVLGAGMPWPN